MSPLPSWSSTHGQGPSRAPHRPGHVVHLDWTRRAVLVALAATPFAVASALSKDRRSTTGIAAGGAATPAPSSGIGTTPTASATTVPTTQLLWSDEFEGPAGRGVDPAVWKSEVGAGGWGNGELQSYTASPRNAALDGQGNLRITMLAEPTTDSAGNRARFTSARIMTRQAYAAGRIEARLQVPTGLGLWAAFWTLGADWDQVGWPRSGEIDVMEHYDTATSVEVVSHAAQIDPAGQQVSGRGWKSPAVREVGAVGNWHVYAVDIDDDGLVFSVDGQAHHEVRRADVAEGQDWPFDQPQRVLLNLAMSRWLPEGTSPPLPASLVVDYVRVYSRP